MMLSDEKLIAIKDMIDMTGGDVHTDTLLHDLVNMDLEVKPCPECGHKFPTVDIEDARIRCSVCGVVALGGGIRDNRKLSWPFNTYRRLRAAAQDWNAGRVLDCDIDDIVSALFGDGDGD